MQIRYKNFLIEEDRSCYVLSEYAITEKGENIGEEYIKDQTYPSTLTKALEKMAYKLRADKRKVLELYEAIETIKIMNSEFIEDIKKLVK